MLIKVEDNQLHLKCNACGTDRVEDINPNRHLWEFENYLAEPCTCEAVEVFMLNRTVDVTEDHPDYNQLQCIQQLNAILKEGN